MITKESAQKMPESNLEDLILEVQTAPPEYLQQAQGALYLAIYFWIDEIAERFGHKWGIAKCDVELLHDLGTAQILRVIGQFEIQTDDPPTLSRRFKAWVAGVCEHRWIDEYRKTQKDLERFEVLQKAEAIEAIEAWDGATISRNEQEIVRQRAAYRYCLDKLPKAYQEALLEIEELREEQGTAQNSRGRGGEARAIAEKHGTTQENIRQCRRRLKKCVEAEYAKETDQ